MTETKSSPRRGASVGGTEDAAIHQLTYNSLGFFARFIARIETCTAQEAALAASFAYCLSNFILWQRLAVKDTDESEVWHGSTPGNLATLQRELRRVGNLASGKAAGHSTNERLAHLLPQDSAMVTDGAEFWRSMAEHFMRGPKGGVQ